MDITNTHTSHTTSIAHTSQPQVPKTKAGEGTQTQQPSTIPLALPLGQQQQGTAAASPTSNLEPPVSPLSTSPAAASTRSVLPMPQSTTTRPQATKRTKEEATGEAESKRQRTHESTSTAQRTPEPPTQKIRIQAVTVTTKQGDTITTTSCEDEEEATIEQMPLEPQVVDNEGLDPVKMQQVMKKETDSMKTQNMSTRTSQQHH